MVSTDLSASYIPDQSLDLTFDDDSVVEYSSADWSLSEEEQTPSVTPLRVLRNKKEYA